MSTRHHETWSGPRPFPDDRRRRFVAAAHRTAGLARAEDAEIPAERAPQNVQRRVRVSVASARYRTEFVMGPPLLIAARRVQRNRQTIDGCTALESGARTSSSGFRDVESRDLVVPFWCQDVLTRGVRGPTARYRALQRRRSEHMRRSRWYAVNVSEETASSTRSRTKSRAEPASLRHGRGCIRR
jgi:hypothetical protein